MKEDGRGIDGIIRDAMARGEFDDLPGKGRPLDLSAYFETPEELRLAHSILKNADILPAEIEILKELAALKDEMQVCQDAARREEIQKAMNERSLKSSLSREKKRARKSRR